MSALIAAAHVYHPLLHPGSLFRASVRPSPRSVTLHSDVFSSEDLAQDRSIARVQSRFGPARMRGRKAAGQITGTTKMIWDLAGASAHSPLWLTLSLSEPAMVGMRPVAEDVHGEAAYTGKERYVCVPSNYVPKACTGRVIQTL